MIDAISGFIVRYLIVLVAAALLPLKWIVARVCRDRDSEAIVVLSLPEDMCYVALGIVLGDVVNHTGAFHRHFEKSQHVTMNIFVVAALNLVIVAMVHRLGQFCWNQYKHWRAAGALRTPDVDPRQGELAIPNADSNFRMIWSRHFSYLSIGYSAQLFLAGVWLHWVAKIVANP
ncbi:MAG: hypothetical protein ACYCOR_14890 [Acidobacteriaceae bacterium]